MQGRVEKTMKEQIGELINGIRNESDINLKETPVVFKWVYEEYPDIGLQLVIEEIDPQEVVMH